MKLWQKILLVLGVLILGLLIFVATRPSHFAVSRSAEMSVPAAKIYPLVADFRQWPKWSPWEKKDLAMKKTYSGAPTGVGQIYEWQGNKDIGKGRMTMLAAEPNRELRIKLEFLDPGPFTNDARFTFVENGGKTTVFWRMEGESDGLMQKAFGLMMDTLVGPDFEAGLAAMKAAAEAN